MLKKMVIIGLTAGALVIGAPVAASAVTTETPTPPDTDTYAEVPKVTLLNAVIETCEASTVTFGAGYFLPGERVAVSISGLNAAAASISGNVAAGDGSMVVSFRPPADGKGTYAIRFAGAAHSGGAAAPGSANARSVPFEVASGDGYTATVTVTEDGGLDSGCQDDPVPADPGTELPLTGSAEASSSDSGLELALTGGGVPALALGGGALALTAGGVLIAVGAARRRRA